MTPDGGDPFQLTYGEGDATAPRWSPDGTRIAYISNAQGNPALQVVEVPGGRITPVRAERRIYREPVGTLRLAIVDARGRPMPARVSITGADGRSFAPDDAWRRGADQDDPSSFGRLVAPLVRVGALELLDGDHRISELLELHHAPGHTPGHQVLRIASGGSRALLSADTWNHPMQLAHPDWWAGSDDDHERSTATRRALLDELLAEPDTVVAPTHFGEAFGHVSPEPGEPAAWHPAI